MEFSDLKECPFCGYDEYYHKNYLFGTSWYGMRFDGKEADNTEMYDGLSAKYGKKAYCRNCNRLLGDLETDKLAKAAERALRVKEDER